MRTLSLAGLLTLVTAGLSTADAATIVVSNTNDTINGNTSNPSALRSSPGSDGISLREAITAANNAAGPHEIKFAATLAGKSIKVTSRLPPVMRNDVTITGLRTSTGQPNITIDAKPAGTNGPTFFVGASSFTMRYLRFTWITQPAAVQVGGSVTGFATSPKSITAIRFTGNAFSHGGSLTGAVDGFGIVAGMSLDTVNSIVSDVVIDNNAFSHMYEGVNVSPSGTGNIVRDVLIFNNTFSNMTTAGTSAVEIGIHNGKNNKALRIKAVQNTFTGNFIGLDVNVNRSAGPACHCIDTTTTGNIIDGTVIERNVFRGNLEAVGMSSGIGAPGFPPKNNTISNTRIVNNVFHRTYNNSTAIHLIDNQEGATGNKIKTVWIINNTIHGPGSGPTNLMLDSTGGITGVEVRNTIFSGITNPVTAGAGVVVRGSIINQSGYTGLNGNFNADPMYVNAAGANFRLQTGSPAIGAGSTTGTTPTDDMNCRTRANPPSIGAYEGNASSVCSKTPPG